MPRVLQRVAVVASLIFALPAGHANAQNTRSFVSGHGSDTNPCTLPAPCRSFQRAHDATAAGGEIAVLDTAGYGSLNITKAISIVNPGGVEAGIAAPANGDAISVNAGTGAVNLRGLTIDGLGTGARGIVVFSASSIVIDNCVIRNLTDEGVQVFTGVDSQFVMSHTLVSSNVHHGVDVAPTNGTLHATFNHTETYLNGKAGIVIVGSNGLVFAMITDSVSAGNNEGYTVVSSATATVDTTIKRSTTSNNISGGIINNGGTSSNITLSDVTTIEPNLSWISNNNGTIFTFGDNVVTVGFTSTSGGGFITSGQKQ